MDVFTFACIVTVVGVLGGCYKATIKNRGRGASSELKETLSKVVDRLDSIERRTSDLETLILEKEKERKYERL